MTVSHVLGCGIQGGRPEYYRGVALETNLLPKVQVDIVVSKIPRPRRDQNRPKRPLHRPRQDLRLRRRKRRKNSHRRRGLRSFAGCGVRLREPLNKSSAAVSGFFSSTLRYRKREILRSRCQRKLAYGCGIPLAGTYSIPPFSIPRLAEKSLAHSSCRFNQSFLRIIIEATPLLIMKCADK